MPNNNPKFPWKSLFIVLAIAAYIISPLDLVPDAFLGLGQLDDLGLFCLGVTQAVTGYQQYKAYKAAKTARKNPKEPPIEVESRTIEEEQ